LILVSRFGLLEELQTGADKIKNSPHLEFTMLHAMISAAHTVEPQALAKSALFAAEKWAKLKQMYPKLTHLNFGGGFPTIDSGYNHKAFLKTYMTGVKEICKRYNVELPTIVVESGSFIATDTEHLVYKVIENNTNSELDNC
jgi:diaminopimelate decarboxylase